MHFAPGYESRNLIEFSHAEVLLTSMKSQRNCTYRKLWVTENYGFAGCPCAYVRFSHDVVWNLAAVVPLIYTGQD